MAGLLGYVFVYTLWLKPRTTQNIVIGGAAGAVPPLVGWAAAAGSLDPSAFYLFAIVFYWTPPHFWALALLIKDDYARTGIPMLPVVDGEAETRRQILLYGWLLLAITALPMAGGLFGAVYASPPLLLGAAVPVPLRAPAPARRPALGRDPVPLLPALPRAPVLRDGRRPGRLSGYSYDSRRPDGPPTRPQEPHHRPRGRRPRGDDLRRNLPGRRPVPGLVLATRPRIDPATARASRSTCPATRCCLSSPRAGITWHCSA